MIYYKIIYFFITKKPEHFHYFDIGIFDTKWQALNVVKELKTKEGFCLRPDKFYIIRVVRFRKPKFLNRTHWAEDFFSYPYSK